MPEEKASTPTVVGRNVGERRKFLMLTSGDPRYWSREALGQRTPMTAGWWKRVERDGQDVPALFLKALNEALQIPIQTPEDVYQILQRDFDPTIAPHPTASHHPALGIPCALINTRQLGAKQPQPESGVPETPSLSS